jgi:hypothetical protein
VNQVRTREHRDVGTKIVASCRDRLGVTIELAGSIDADPNVTEAVERRQPAIQAFPLCRFSRQIEALAKRLEREAGDLSRERNEAGGRRASRVGLPAVAEVTPSCPLPPLDRDAPGSYLRRCREALGLSLAEMTERTRIRILDQIESERFDLLPPEPYLRGYLFEYARALELPDVAELAKCYLAKAPPRPAETRPALVVRRHLRGWRG